MKNQNNNRKKTHTTYSITNTHTHINIDKYTQKTEMNGTICFLKQFFVSKPGWNWFPQNGAWTALKPPPNVLKPARTCLSPLGFPKKEPGQPQNHPQPKKKKKSRKKKKRIPKTIPHPIYIYITYHLLGEPETAI